MINNCKCLLGIGIHTPNDSCQLACMMVRGVLGNKLITQQKKLKIYNKMHAISSNLDANGSQKLRDQYIESQNSGICCLPLATAHIIYFDFNENRNSRSKGGSTCGGRVVSLPAASVSITAKCADACVIPRLFLARHSYMPD